jgi:hypothetical protein
MAGRQTIGFLALILACLVTLHGCGGVIYEMPRENGRVERLRLDTGEGWESYDTTPRYRSQKPKDLENYSIMLKNEATF